MRMVAFSIHIFSGWCTVFALTAGLAPFFPIQVLGQEMAGSGHAANLPDGDSTVIEGQALSGVTVTSHQTTLRDAGAVNATSILRGELFKAACCNLGESFVNNPSVDVNYSDATTGARQIKLLGLSGKYVQMLTENLPNFRGAAMPYGLSYVPGTWMQSIQVSTGNASVKNGYEAMTGQINVEYLKPEDEEHVNANIYGNTMSRLEADADGNIHLGHDLATELLAHFENNWSHHDGNGDGFQDMPNVRQYNLQNRWYWKTGHYLFHGGLSLLKEDRSSGQSAMHSHQADGGYETDDRRGLYRIDMATDRYEAYMKHAYIFGDSHNSNIALMGNVSMHEQNNGYGLYKYYDVNEKTAYASLMFESDVAEEHNLSVGLSVNHDYLHQNCSINDGRPVYERHLLIEKETTPGGYAQYTYNHGGKLILMAGLRLDHSSVYGSFWTPRFHMKWTATPWMTLRGSAGMGYRTPMALAENNYLIASGRKLDIDSHLNQEKAWNFGLTANFYIPVGFKTLKLNAQYYYTRFSDEMVIDYDSNPTGISIGNLDGLSYSHTFQGDASISAGGGLDLSMAYRYNLVKSTYGGKRLWKPLQSRYKGLFSASWKPGLGLWQMDMTLALNGGGRMPKPYTLADGSMSWKPNFRAYPMLNLQVKRLYRHFEVYIGGENLTGYKQKHPIIGADNPWSESFEPTMVYGPVTGAMGYAGVRVKI